MPDTRTPPRPTERATFEQLIRSIRTVSNERDARARIRLDPPELGHIRIDLRVADGRVTLGMETETDEARELLRSRVDQLRGALARHGLAVDRIELGELPPSQPTSVSWPGHEPSDATRHASPQRGDRQPSQRRRAARERAEAGELLSTSALQDILNHSRAVWEARLDIKA